MNIRQKVQNYECILRIYLHKPAFDLFFMRIIIVF
jgi:hypothetical protein